MALCSICEEQCSISDHRKKLKKLCRICKCSDKKPYTKILKVKDRKELITYKNHKYLITNIFNVVFKSNSDRYPESFCKRNFQILHKLLQFSFSQPNKQPKTTYTTLVGVVLLLVRKSHHHTTTTTTTTTLGPITIRAVLDNLGN